MPNEETKQLSQSSCKPCGQRFLYVLGISGIFPLNLLHMKRLQPDIAVEDDSEQVWIAKYRAAISEPPPKPLFKRMVGHLGYVVGIILGKSKRFLTAARPKPQLVKGTGIKKKRLGRARNPKK